MPNRGNPALRRRIWLPDKHTTFHSAGIVRVDATLDRDTIHSVGSESRFQTIIPIKLTREDSREPQPQRTMYNQGSLPFQPERRQFRVPELTFPLSVMLLNIILGGALGSFQR